MGGGYSGLYQGTPVGYRLLVAKPESKNWVEAKCERMQPLLIILRDLENIDYEFIKLERIFGG